MEAILERMQFMEGRVPLLPIELDDVSVVVGRKVASGGDTVLSALSAPVANMFEERTPLYLLKDVSATFPVGTTTLVIAPPGAGKTALLRLLSGTIDAPTTSGVPSKLPSDPTAYGKFRIGGLDAHEVGSSRLRRMVARVGQDDLHFGLLKVRETIDLAVEFSTPPASQVPSPGPGEELRAKKTDILLQAVGLDHVGETILGTELERGVSGGEAKRVTIAEAIAAPSRAIVLDDASNGLDGARTKKIVELLGKVARTTKIPIVASLQQPSREIFDLFDRVLVLRSGRVLYEGPRQDVGAYMASLGLVCPPRQSVPDWLLEFASDPSEFAPDMDVLRRFHENGPDEFRLTNVNDGSNEENSHSSPSDVELNTDPSTSATTKKPQAEEEQEEEAKEPATPSVSMKLLAQELPVHTTDKLAEHFATKGRQLVPRTLIDTDASKLWPKDPLSDLVFGEQRSVSFAKQVLLLLWREWALLSRDRAFFAAHFVRVAVVGGLLGGLFSDSGRDDFTVRLALSFFALLFLGIGNLAELPGIISNRKIVDKQVNAGLYHQTAYTIATALIHIPVAFLEALIFSSIVYWASNFAPEGDRFGIFLCIVWLANLLFAAYFRLVAWASGDSGYASAQAAATGPLALALVTSGFIVTLENLSDVLGWIYWITPLSWTVRALSINEFNAERYDEKIPEYEIQKMVVNGTPRAMPVQVGEQRLGDAYLEAYDLPTDDVWVMGGILFAFGQYLLFLVLGAVVFSIWRTYGSRGTTRLTPAHKEEVRAQKAHDAALAQASAMDAGEVDASSSGAAAGVEAVDGGKAEGASDATTEGATLAWKGIKYSVTLKDGTERTLLSGIDGFARPGQITALLGVSGAGKSTLLDCLAGRKTMGKLIGDILIDGRKVENRDEFNAVAAYIEQFDFHFPQDTVREAVAFSASARLSTKLSDADREKIIDHVLDLLELRDIADTRVGLPGVSGISSGERKRLSIAVELVAQPKILFLDEPTTGLSSLQARGVVRVLRRIADAGHAIVCTVHQPSATIFKQFDRLLLLQTGGRTVYFGDLGQDGADMIGHLQSHPGVRPIPMGVNPADWMLEEVTKIADSEKHSKPAKNDDEEAPPQQSLVHTFESSTYYTALQADLNEAMKPKSDSSKLSAVAQALQERPTSLQLAPTLLIRIAKAYYRSPDYNNSRLLILLVIGLLFGFIFYDLDRSDQSGVLSSIGALFMSALFAGIINLNASIAFLIASRPALYRELAAGFYAPPIWSIIITLVELPWCIIASLFFCSTFYFLVGFEESNFGYFWSAVFLVIYLFTNVGHLLSVAMPTQQLATAATGGFMAIQGLFAGFFLPRPDFTPGWIWLHYLSTLNYALEILVMPQFHCENEDDIEPDVQNACGSMTALIDGERVPNISKEDFLDEFFGLKFSNVPRDYGILIALTVVFIIIKTVVITKVRHQSK